MGSATGQEVRPLAFGRELVRGEALAWLVLAVAASLVSSLYAVVLIVARSGIAGAAFEAEHLFATALVLHVDFSVLVWFLSCGALLWSRVPGGKGGGLGRVAIVTAAAGATTLALAPMLIGAEPILSDYVLVLDHPLFQGALALFFVGVALYGLRFLIHAGPTPGGWLEGTQGWLKASVATFLAAFALLLIDLLRAPGSDLRLDYFQWLFWNGGHTLQLHYGLLVVVSWILLSSGSGRRPLGWRERIAIGGPLGLALVSIATALILPEARAIPSVLMALGGLCIVPVLVAELRSTQARAAAERWLRLRPMVGGLFLVGIGLGFLIRQDDAMVPAHYHGVIGAITLTFMLLLYRLLPTLGLGEPSAAWIRVQGWIYTVGLLCMISGLIVADIPRKTATLADGDWTLIAGRALTGIGGTLALLGSLLFVAILIRAVKASRRGVVACPTTE